MAASEELFLLQPEHFSGVARLFPLPNLVLFPHVLQPLHIFEPRYRALVEEAMAADRLIAMALLEPGWEPDYEGRPPLSGIACLGRITTAQRLDDGRYNILLAGLKRVRLLRELPPKKLFREAQVELFDDFYPSGAAVQRPLAQRRLVEAFRRSLPNMPEAHEQLDQLLAGDVCLGTLTDILAYTLDLDPAIKQRLLAEQNVDRRAALLLDQLEQAGLSPAMAAGRGKDFPPGFSSN
jgi:ATP-dependent Lon protease